MEFTSYHSSSKANLYSIRSGGKTLLVEAGLRGKAIRKALDFGLSSVDGCLISHSHGDHARGALDLMGYGIDTYMTAETADAIGADGHRLHVIEPLKQFTVDGWTVLPFDTQHDCPGSVGFLISDGTEKLLFATDTYYAKYRFNGCAVYAVECNYSPETMSPDISEAQKKRLLTSHFSLENVKKFFRAQDLSRCHSIFLLHLSRDNSNAELFRREIMAVTGLPVTVAEE